MANPQTQLGLVGLNAYQADVCTASSAYIAVPISGVVVAASGVVYAAIGTADCAITVEKNGTAVSGMTATLTTSGSAAGDDFALTIPRGLYVTAGDVLEVISDGAGSNTVPANWTVIIQTTGRAF